MGSEMCIRDRAWFLVTLGKFGKETSGSSLSLPDVRIVPGNSAPAGRTLGRWLRSCLPWIALAVSCITAAAPPLSCLSLADSGMLSEGDSSAVLKSDESDWASWMYCWNSPAGWRCSLTKVNLVGFGDAGLLSRVGLVRFCLGGDLLRGSFSSAEDT